MFNSVPTNSPSAPSAETDSDLDPDPDPDPDLDPDPSAAGGPSEASSDFLLAADGSAVMSQL